ncbi:MAG: hypothetical protein WCP20_11815 [Desulfuromonadales bacterium]
MNYSEIVSSVAALFFSFILISAASAAPVCVNATGESIVLRGDLPSAKIEAVNRAKFAAVEQVAGVDVKSRTVVEDSALLDDIITTRTRGVVTGYRIVKEAQIGDTAKVVVNVCVEPVNAREAMSSLSLNTAISVYLPARKLTRSGKQEYDDENFLSQSIIGKLAEQGYSVRDLAESHALKLKDIDAALKGGDQTSVRSLAYRYLANSILIGKVEPVASAVKGSDAGYGISMPFNAVTARLTYRLMAKDSSGKMVVLSAGNEEAKGLAPNQEDAYAEALKNLSEVFLPVIVDKIHSRLDEISGKVLVKIIGVKDPAETFALRDQLQKISWVTKVEEKGLDELWVSFSENPIYLANGLSQKGFRITAYSREAITVQRRQ